MFFLGVLLMPFHIPLQVQGVLSTISFLDIVDILIVALILYKLYAMLQGTRAITLVKGLLVILALTLVCNWLSLHVIYWLLQQTLTLLFVALPIVFQPELRRTLEHLGQGRFLGKSLFLDDDEARNLVNAIDRAVMKLSSEKTGALLVFERDMGLKEFTMKGIQLDALISSELLGNVFVPNTPLHDGAAIFRGNRLIAAGCMLPLTDNSSLSMELGSRHRAALGLSEQTDALVVVVSEETGTVSVAENGRLTRRLSSEHLKTYLRPIFIPKTTGIKDMFSNWRKGK